jgi:hypothetical protein
LINPPALALRRRCEELFLSAERERPHNADSAALLLVYCAECGLKAAYMLQNSLKMTDESRGGALSARSFGHNIRSLIQALNISRSSIKAPPAIVVERTGQSGDPAILHEAWRYGEKIRDTNAVCEWLISLIDWCRNNR